MERRNDLEKPYSVDCYVITVSARTTVVVWNGDVCMALKYHLLDYLLTTKEKTDLFVLFSVC